MNKNLEWIIRFEQWLEDNELESFIGFEVLEIFRRFKNQEIKEGNENETD